MDWRVQSSSLTAIDTKTNFSGQPSHGKTNFKVHKKHARCYQCGHRGHFGKDCLNGSNSSTPGSPKCLIPAHKGRRHHKHHHQKGKRSYAHITASAPTNNSSDSCSSVSNEAYCVQSDFTAEDDTAWFADSHATEHMTDKLRWFTNFHVNDDQCWSVIIADNHLLYVRGIGDIYVNALVNGIVSTIKLKNILYVPQLRRNLISIGRLTERRVAIIHVRNMCNMINNYVRTMLL